MKTLRTLTREARTVCAILVLSILALLWAIQVDASLGDDYGALVLAGALATISALGAFIVTSELRDNNAKQLRARMSRLHTQQVNTLSDAIVKLENRYDTLNDLYNESVITHARDKSRLVSLREQRDALALRIAIQGDIDATLCPTVTDYTHSASTALMLGTLDKAYALANGETVYPLA